MASVTGPGRFMLAAWVPPLDHHHPAAAHQPVGQALGLVHRDGQVGGAVDDQGRNGDLTQTVLDPLALHEGPARDLHRLLGPRLPPRRPGRREPGLPEMRAAVASASSSEGPSVTQASIIPW